jgi:hypothetical protein
MGIFWEHREDCIGSLRFAENVRAGINTGLDLFLGGYETMSEAVNIGDVLDVLNVKLPATAVEQAAVEQEQAEKGKDEGGELKPEGEEAEAGDQTEPDTATVEDEQTDDGEEAEESEEESEDEAAGEDKEARAVRKLSKRVDKLTARAKSAEEEVQTFKSKLAETEEKLGKAQPIILQDSQDILADVMTTEELDARVASASTVIDQVPDLLSEADADGEVQVKMGDGSVKTFTREDLHARLQRAKQIVKGEASRRAFLAQREPAVADAKREYPELFQEDHAARKLMLDTLKLYPGMAKMPNVELAIGDMINGYVMRLERQKESGKRKAETGKVEAKKAEPAKPKIAPSVIKPSAQPKTTKPKGDGLDALRSEGTRSAAERFVSNLFG